MFQQSRSNRARDMFMLGGWLFADLLLALSMIFLVSINGAPPPLPQPCITPAPGTATTTAQSAGALARPGEVNGALAPADIPTESVPLFATPTQCPSPTPTPTQFPCGLDLSSTFQPDPITLSNQEQAGLLVDDPTAQQQFDAQVMVAFAAHANQIAGLVETFGGGPDSGAGQNLAVHANTALKLLGDQHPPFVFERNIAVFQSYWDGTIASNQVEIYVIFYHQSKNGSCAQSQS